MEHTSHDIACYGGFVTDEQDLMSSTSGGIATALARTAIAMGGVVAGVTYSDDFYHAQYYIARREEELSRFKGSKYVEVQHGSIYSDVKALLEQGTFVLFFGLPCTVAALRKYVGGDRENLMTVELICNGPALAEVHRQYIAHLEKKYKSKIVDFAVRRKEGTWMPGYLYARFENGKVFNRPFYSTEYWYAFSVTTRQSCYQCRFRGDNRTGDIMIGDYLNAGKNDPFWNEKGVSAILVHTQKGLEFLNATQGIRLFDTTFEHILKGNKNILNPRPTSPVKESFEALFAQHGLFYATSHTMSFKTKFKRRVLMMIPARFRHNAKKAFGRLVKKLKGK